MGFLYFWDVYIDVVVVMLLIMTIGICVDYSTHIAHAYDRTSGNKCNILRILHQISMHCYIASLENHWYNSALEVFTETVQ